MLQRAFHLAIGITLTALCLAWCVPINNGAEEPKVKEAPTAKQIRAALAKRTTLENGIDPNTPLKDALEFLSQHTTVPIIIDTKAFEAIGVQKVEEQPVQLPKLKNVRLAHVLRLLLGQVRGDVHTGTFLVRPDYLEITTTYNALSEVAGSDAAQLLNAAEDGSDKPRLLHIVYGDFEKRPLDDALRELTESSGVNIVVDPRCGEKSKTPVSATINNMFLDTAVELLVDMADLQAVQIDAVIYLTTRDNAAKFEARQKAKKPVPQPNMPPQPGVNPFIPGIVPGRPPA